MPKGGFLQDVQEHHVVGNHKLEVLVHVLVMHFVKDKDLGNELYVRQ